MSNRTGAVVKKAFFPILLAIFGCLSVKSQGDRFKLVRNVSKEPRISIFSNTSDDPCLESIGGKTTLIGIRLAGLRDKYKGKGAILSLVIDYEKCSVGSKTKTNTTASKQITIRLDDLSSAEWNSTTYITRPSQWSFKGGKITRIKEDFKAPNDETEKEKPTECVNKLGSGIIPSTYRNLEPGQDIILSVAKDAVLCKDFKWVWYQDEVGGERLRPDNTGKSVRVRPEATTTYFVRAESSRATSVTRSITIRVMEKAQTDVNPMIEPTDVIGKRTVRSNEEVTLKVFGGVLPPGGAWVWYKGDCVNGEFVHQGDTYRFRPNGNATYYVRGEAQNYQPTICKRVDITIEDNNIRPERVVFGDGLEYYCGLGKRVLKIEGGSLERSSQWVWYEKRSTGDLRIATGRERIEVEPRQTTTYYVTAEGKGGTTEPVGIVVQVYPMPVSAQSITRSIQDPSICEGTPITLTAIPEKASIDQKWIWRITSEGTEKLVTTETSKITVYPSSTSVYSVSGSNVCGKSREFSETVKVISKTTPPGRLYRETDGKKGTSIFSISDGKLGDQAEWYWYEEGKDGESTPIGTGSSVTLKHRSKKTPIYAIGKGICNETGRVYDTIPKKDAAKLVFLNVGPITNGFSLSDSNRVYDFNVALGIGRFYVKGTLGPLNSLSPQAKDLSSPEFEADDQRILNYPINSGTYYEFTKQYYPRVRTYTVGMYAGATMKGFGLNFYGGLGFGSYDLIWGVNRYSYANNSFLAKSAAKNIRQSVSGPCVEGGLLLHLGILNIMGGTNVIIPTAGKKPYVSGHLGLGLSLTRK